MPKTAASLAPHADPSRWKALVFIALAQLMVVLDATIVNIALPSAQTDLGISDGNRQWVITAYALAFGGLLLFGGRIADKWGRKNAFVVGLIGFALASALGGAANGEAMMLGARALQGAFGALLAPAALSLLAVMFTDAKERAKAFGIYGAIAGGGGAVGLILGGFLTEYLNWRWTFFVNIPFAIVAAVGAWMVIREHAGSRNRAPLDIPGVILSTTGLVALVYGFTRAESVSWSDALTVTMFVASALLLASFVLVESRVKSPLLPLRVLLERNRGGVYLSLGLAVISMFGLFLFLTYYLQIVKGFSPVKTGFAFLPMIAGMITGSTQIGARLMTRVPPRLLMGPGFLVAALGMLLLTQLEVGSSYPALILAGAAAARPRHGHGVHAGDVPGHARGEPGRRRCRLRHGQHLAAGRRRHRHRAAEHHRRLGDHRLPDRPRGRGRGGRPGRAADPGAGHGRGLRLRHLVGGRHPGRQLGHRPGADQHRPSGCGRPGGLRLRRGRRAEGSGDRPLIRAEGPGE